MNGNYVKKMSSRFDTDGLLQKCRLLFSRPTPQGSSRNRSTYTLYLGALVKSGSADVASGLGLGLTLGLGLGLVIGLGEGLN